MVTPVVIQGLPYDANSSFMRGATLGPTKIRDAIRSPSANMWTELGVDLGNTPEWTDAGDLSLWGWPASEANVAIQGATEAHIAKGHRVISLGGDHSISLPVIAAHAGTHQDLTVVQIDAHGDLYDDFDGNPFSHASVFARLMEAGHIKHLVQVGIRTLTQHQREQQKRFGVTCYEMKDFRDFRDLDLGGKFYISLDLDGLDPAFAPGVGHHEPGGLTSRQVIDIIQRSKGELIGADIVEMNPLRDLNGMTSMVAARMVKELSGRLLTGGMVQTSPQSREDSKPEAGDQPAPPPGRETATESEQADI